MMTPNRTLRARVAAQSAMSAVVGAQVSARRPGPLARIFGVSPLTHEARPHYRGALGELLVGDVLENLGPTWDVLHDIPLDDDLLDHLLIGPAGVFTVRTVNHGRNDVIVDGDVLSVAGEKHHDIASANAEALEVAHRLSEAAGRPVAVHPLLVLVDPRRLIVRCAPATTRVIASRDLARALALSASTLTGEEVAHVSDLADLETTWPQSETAKAAVDTQQLHRDFGLIRMSVNDAVVRRVLWGTIATVAVYVSVWWSISTLVTIMMDT